MPAEALADPISDLPPEISGEIFLRCIPPSRWGSFSAHDAPWLLTKVCHSWREVALSMPLLWTGLPFLCEGHWESEDSRLRLLELYLERSAETALVLGLGLSPNPVDAPFLPLVTPHLSRAQYLCITYHHELTSQRGYITHKHFPLLKNLALFCLCPEWALQSREMTAGLEGIEFPWAQLTRLTVKMSSSAETLALLKDCSSLEVFRLMPSEHSKVETSPTVPTPKTTHLRLRELSVENGPFSAELLGRLVTPALSAAKFTQPEAVMWGVHSNNFLCSILSFIKNSPAKLTSLTLGYIECSPQNLVDLSALIPTISRLDLEGFSEESLQCLAIKSGSPHGVLFPCIRRLIIRNPFASESALLDIFYSRLYLAPNTNIIENTSPLEHALLYTSSPDRYTRTYFGELYQDRPELRGLILQLQHIYSETAGLDKETSGRSVGVIHRINQDGFPKQEELGYCEVTLAEQACSPSAIVHSPLLPLFQRFFQKLDAAFTVLEGYQIIHAVEILVRTPPGKCIICRVADPGEKKNEADTLMRGFSCLPETAFLHHPTYKFHTRATRLLEQWQPMISEYEARDKWICERETMDTLKLAYRRTMHL
ncbi:hypothetical protein BD779DRAFT_1565958 [Infundibulicybe gibba]|nr:hypothetical protein BD779DRAFT_1565958 [Infundibulicybe gibba]